MNRVETAIAAGRCVLVFGSRALQDVEALGELRRRGAIPSTVLVGDPPSPALPLGPDVLAPALTKEGGVIVLVEADTLDAAGLATLAAMVQSAPHKPRLVVAARAFNPFMLPTPLRLLKFEHEKFRAKDFLQSLPVPAPVVVATAAAAVAVVAEEPKKKTGGAPKVQFVGREEELAALKGFLATGGPIAVVGPQGIGKHWLVDRALQGGPYRRLPDFHVGWGSEGDSLLARLAMFGEKAGDRRLADLLRSPGTRPPPAEIVALAVEMLNLPAAADVVFVIDRLEHVMRRDGTFHRESRLEMVLRALLTGTYAARVVFLTTIRPRFYREGEGANLRVLDLAGLKGRELHEIFEAYRVDDFPREHFGDIINRVYGHPVAVRLFALAVRGAEDRAELMDNKRFMQMADVGDLEPLRRRFQKAVEALPEDERRALGVLAHFRLPFTAAEAEELGYDRRMRLALLGRGVIESGLEETGDRTFRVHPLVQAALSDRETSDFQLFERLGEGTLNKASRAEGLERLALAQEGNRLLFAAHRIRNRMRVPYPDHDPALESLRGLIRSKKPRLDLAEQRLAECLNLDPTNPELLLMRAELLIAKKATPELIQAAYDEAAQAAPTPEVFHQEATWHQAKTSGRGKAAAALEKAVALFPNSGRLRRRLAGILVDQNKLDEAVEMLKAAMELEPMMPDSYGLLGEIHLIRGPTWYDAAEEALMEARRLDPDNALHMARLGALLVERAEADPTRREEAIRLLESAISADGKNYLSHLYLGRMLVDGLSAPSEDGAPPDPIQVDRADYLLKKAAKLEERAALPLVERARIAILRKEWGEADQLLEKAMRLEPACHEAFNVRGAMLMAQGHIFPALSEFQRALERSPKESKARPAYERSIAQCRVLIESGAAIEMAKQAEASGLAAPEVRPHDAVRREPGKTTRRRRGRRGEAAVDEASGEAGEAALAGEDSHPHDEAGGPPAHGGSGDEGDDNSRHDGGRPEDDHAESAQPDEAQPDEAQPAAARPEDGPAEQGRVEGTDADDAPPEPTEGA